MNVLNFATVDDYVEWSLRDLPRDLVTGFTIVFWAKITASDAGGAIFGEEVASGADFTGLTMDFGASNFLYFVDKGANVSSYEVTTYAGAWHHFAYVFTDTNVNLYIDGVFTFAGSGPLTQGFKKGSKMRIGKSVAGDLPSSIFKMCNFHIYLRELTLTEINKLFQYQAFYFEDLETYFRLDTLTGRFTNQLTGASYPYISSGATILATNELDIYDFKFAEVQVPQAAFNNALKESQRTTIPKMTTVGELLLSTGRDLTGCSILDLFITDASGNLVFSPIEPYVWYHFDETSGTSTHDSSRNMRDGIFFPGSGGGFTAGKLSNAILFVGDTYVNGGDICDFDWDQPFSLEAWIYFTNDGYPRTIMSRIDRSAQNRGFTFFTNDGYPTLYLSNDESIGKAIYAYGNTQIGDATYHHVVATYEGNGLASGIKIYVDGVSQVIGVATDNLQRGTIRNSAKFAIGCANLIDLFYFGSIDEVVVYTAVLTQDQINFRYNGGAGTEQMMPSTSIVPIPGMIIFPIPSPVLETPGEYKVQLKFGNDLFVDYSPIHTLEVVDTLE